MEDFDCKEGYVEIMVTESKLLKHANEEYTIGVYRLVVCNESKYVYKIWHPNIASFRHIVAYNESTLNISYTCKIFNEVVILCSSCLCIFNILCVQAIPDKYILKRWTKDLDLSLGSSSVGDIGKVSKKNIASYSA
ncbi:hypothetical protein M9H77_22200 [Catharanthus roseus]|uniref:Uncharacterized protein n=1 Tax=Catharanthus roseus TaxID=4058 RepID=A0ACC0APG2_CATRO|nr:hypothetical protein M9H77_22200 [Catharanthus roseus]